MRSIPTHVFLSDDIDPGWNSLTSYPILSCHTII